jgi:4-hydroxy-3-polyprenylbenzoate decarboxylase
MSTVIEPVPVKSATRTPVIDLRSALKLLENTPGQLLRSDCPVDPNGELAGVYRHVGAGGTVERSKIGPAMLFQNIKNYPGHRVIVGVMASRERTALLLDAPAEHLGQLLLDAVRKPIDPVVCKGKPACQEVVHKDNINILKTLPAPNFTPEDAGPYFTMGLLRATDPETGETDVTIHRCCVQSDDTISIFFSAGRHLDVFRRKAEAKGQSLPLSISIGLDPAIYLASCFEPPTTPLGYDELAVAGAIRGQPVELSKCLTINEYAIANAEVVIEGEILPNIRVREDQHTNTGKAMPEFPGYNGPANPSLPIMKVTAITHRKNPILEAVCGPGEEHVSLAGIPTEASILGLCQQAMPGHVQNVYCHSSGGGKFLAVVQVKKSIPSDEGRARQAGIVALAAYRELKHVILVDEDVDIFNTNDVLWAMQTRYQGDVSTVFIPGAICHQLDPSQQPEFRHNHRMKGITCKTIFDCTAPWEMKDQFERAQFQEIPDLEKFLVPSTKPVDL